MRRSAEKRPLAGAFQNLCASPPAENNTGLARPDAPPDRPPVSALQVPKIPRTPQETPKPNCSSADLYLQQLCAPPNPDGGRKSKNRARTPALIKRSSILTKVLKYAYRWPIAKIPVLKLMRGLLGQPSSQVLFQKGTTLQGLPSAGRGGSRSQGQKPNSRKFNRMSESRRQ